MNVLHFSSDDITGGAAKAAYRLHDAFRQVGHSSHMIVRNKKSNDDDVEQVASIPASFQKRVFSKAQQRIPSLNPSLPIASHVFNMDVTQPIDLQLQLRPNDGVDFIFLHWITSLLTVENIRRIYDHYRCPVLWIMMDQEPITGGCHYSFGCDGYQQQCGSCPQLTPRSPNDRSHTVWLRKREQLSDIPLSIIAPTSWALDRARKSSLFGSSDISFIPLLIDTTIFRPFDKRAARDLLHIPQSKKVIFFGAAYLEEPRKGIAYLLQALEILSKKLEDSTVDLRPEDILLVVAGNSNRTLLDSFPFEHKSLGLISEDLVLALAYQAADVFACPSVEDAGPMMIPESLLCGTPVVAFDAGGAPDLIETTKTGYLAKFKDSADFADGMLALLTTHDINTMRDSAHRAALARHDPTSVIDLYQQLFDKLKAQPKPT